MNQILIVSRLAALATFVIIQIVAFMCYAKSADNAERDSARQQLAERYFVDYNDGDEMAKAVRENNYDELRLFIRAGATIETNYIIQAIGEKNLDKLRLLVSESKEGRFSSLREKVFFDTFDNMNDLSTECAQFENVLEMLNFEYDHIYKGFFYIHSSDEYAPRVVCPTLCSGFWKKIVQNKTKNSDYVLRAFGAMLKKCTGEEVGLDLEAREVSLADDSKIIKVSCPMMEHDSWNAMKKDVDPFWNASNQAYISNAVSMLIDANRQLCETGSLKHCKVIKEYNEEVMPLLEAKKTVVMKKQLATVKQREYEKSPQSIYDNACKIQNQIDIANKLIRQQGRIGEEAGVVDMNTIYRAGMLKTYAEDNLNELRRRYRNKTGKELDASKCK